MIHTRIQILFITLVVALATGTAAPRNESACVPRSCYGDQCPEVTCDHGNCDDEGICRCQPCWHGDICDSYSNGHYPKFASRHLSARINNGVATGSTVHEMQASDDDFKSTCNSQKCDCAKMSFEITSGNSDGFFSINPHSGKIILEKPLTEVIDGRVFTLQVSVVNEVVEGKGGDIAGPKDYATIKITVGDGIFDEEDNQNEAVLDRYRRQAAVPNTVSNMTFTLVKTGDSNYTTTMKVGSRVHFQLQIQFPQPAAIDLSVELFSPENTSTIMAICNPVIVHSGSSLTYNKTLAEPALDANDGSKNYDRAVLNFGNVISGSGTGLANVIRIEWDVVMIVSANTVNGSYYWVSAGAEYNQQNEIWVGQAGFVAIVDDFNTSTSTPQFDVAGPSKVAIGSTALFKVDMFLPYPSIELNFDVFAPFNFTDAASVCSILVSSVGLNYECYQYHDLPLTLYPSSSGATKERGTLYMGRVVNKGSRDLVFNWTESRITVHFVIYLPYNESLIGENLWVGSTLELGTDQIWAGQISFQAISASAAAPLNSPPTTNIYPYDGTLSTYLHRSKALSLNVSITPSTTSNYTLVFTTDGTKYRTCAAEIKFRGDNIPCFWASDPTYSTTAAGLETNKVEWALGTIENKIIKSTSLDPYADILQILLYVVPVSYSGMALNDQATVSGDITGSNSQTSSFTQILTLSNITDLANATGSAAPTANISYFFGPTSISTNVNQTVVMFLKIAFYPKVLNNPVTIIFQAPNSSASTNQFSIIRAEILSVGKNMPCTQQFKLNASFQYLSMPNSEHAHTVILRAGAVNSVANPPVSTFYPTDDDILTVRVLIFINDITPLPATGNFLTSFTYMPSASWNNTQTFTVTKQQNFKYISNSSYFVVYDYTLAKGSSIPAGQQFSTKILLKTPPKSVADWIIRADVSHDLDLSVCAIYVVEVGYDVTYVNTSTFSRKVSSSPPTVYSSAWLELYKMTNIGNQTLNRTAIFDVGSVVVGVLIQVSKSSPASTKHVKLSVDTGMDGNDSNSDVTFDVVAPGTFTYSAAAINPNISFVQTKVNENSSAVSLNVYKGQTLILTSEFSYPLLHASHSLAIQLQAPADDSVDIVELNVVHVGQNFPCLEKRSSIRTLSKTGSNVHHNRADLDLGVICCLPLNKMTAEQSKVRIEAIATIVRESSAAIGSTITISSLININGTIKTQDLTFTLVASAPTDQDFNLIGSQYARISTSQDDITMPSFSTHTFNATISVLANTSDAAIISVQLPMGSISAVMTVEYLQLINFGRNLGSVTIPFINPATYTSTKLTSQEDKASLNLGRITNTGHTYRAGIYEEGDDDIVVEVSVQMADAKEAVDGKSEVVTYAFSYLGILPTNRSNVLVSKPSTDDIDLLLVPNVDSSIVYSGGDKVSLTFNLLHNNHSRAEPFDVAFIFYFPKCFEFLQATFKENFINPARPTANFNAGNKYFYIFFPHVYFTDNITFSFDLQIISNMLFSNAPQEIVRLSYELEMKANPKSTPTTPGTKMTYPMKFINLTMNTSPIQTCPSEVTLGMASSIQDCQISGSLGINDYINARPSGTGWIPGLRKGSFKRYLQVRLNGKTKLTKVTITQKSIERIKEILLMYSDDGLNWLNGDLLTAPDSSASTDISIPNPVAYSYVRLAIGSTYTADAMPAFTVELWGCVTTPTSLTATELCPKYNGWQSPPAMDEFNIRGLALDTTRGYLCDVLPNMGELKCFSSPDGITWQALDKSVINILGFLASKNRLYGLDKNKMAIVMSEDNGKTWVTASKAYYLREKTEPGFIPAKNVPWNSQIGNNPVTQGAFNAKFDGLYYNSNKVADWMECCS